MAHQFKIVALPEDMNNLSQVLKEKMAVVFVDEEAPGNELQEVGDLAIAKMGISNLKVFLTTPELVGEVKLRISGRKIPVVDSLRSNVIEMSRCFHEVGFLRAGRLYYESGYYDAAGDWRAKPDEFLRWANALFVVMKKTFPRDVELNAYVGPAAAKWRKISGNTISLP